MRAQKLCNKHARRHNVSKAALSTVQRTEMHDLTWWLRSAILSNEDELIMLILSEVLRPLAFIVTNTAH